MRQTASAECSPNLGGKWQLILRIPAGQSFAGEYRGTLKLEEKHRGLVGRVDDWSNGARSRLRGSYRHGRLQLFRVDDAPYAAPTPTKDLSMDLDAAEDEWTYFGGL